MKPANLYLDFGQSSLKASQGDDTLEVPLEREANGRLTQACKEEVMARCRAFVKQRSWQPRQRAVCAISARGVSLRRLTLPAAGKEELERLLRLQIESEFPLPPEQLAWGHIAITSQAPANGAARQELLVAAVKREALEDYSQILTACGLSPTFTLAALARHCLLPQSRAAGALLNIGRNTSELITFQDGVPASIRVLPWGGANITRAIQEKLGISYDEAERLKLKLDLGPFAQGDLGKQIEDAVGSALEALAERLDGVWPTLYLTGRSARQPTLAPLLASRLGRKGSPMMLEPIATDGRSAAILGLKQSYETSRATPPLLLPLDGPEGSRAPSNRPPRKWVALAAALAFCLLALPYAQALLFKSRLTKKLANVEAQKARLGAIDRELAFLQFLKKNQPPYLDALFLIARATVPGTRFDSLAMNRKGDITLRGNMRDSSQVVEFRTKLINSGFFSNVSVEEQTPTPDRQKVIVRISAQWKPETARENLRLDSLTNEPIPAVSSSAGPMMPGLPGDGMPFGPPMAMPPPAKMDSPNKPGPSPPPPSEIERSNAARKARSRVIRQGDGPALPPGLTQP